ncbi:DUF2182 domain-containing protein [Novosphingobium sp. KN65.2]|uniref:DUF2182 domain-containing protein n=1 Tax=Novosphingobium sp. KN65.2 TaxID=1478134 RepID=UPI0005E58E00|nr:DUF2182 domain-containing protein [Novosphingobium sp. KN65.2]CDO37412.1 conserved membrane hypothetical protein [Novosphingobium sp. KN65.2]
MATALEGMLTRHRAVTVAMLFALTVLAWIWLASGAGTGMAPGFRFPDPMPGAPATMHGSDNAMSGHMGASMGAMPGMAETAAPWALSRFLLTFAMWWVMMVAMMLPSAASTILLHARAGSAGAAGSRPATGSFLSGYLLVWGLFSFVATVLQMALERAGIMAGMDMVSVSRPFSAVVLLLAGLYQLSPFKETCLRHCRNPAQFLTRHYRPGRAGALRMGLLHGAYCAGCCWLLMALLFVGGVMNLVWIAFLTLVVAAEKLLPGGRWIAIAGGLACIAWGTWIVLA